MAMPGEGSHVTAAKTVVALLKVASDEKEPDGLNAFHEYRMPRLKRFFNF
jgi:hypothetical protein